MAIQAMGKSVKLYSWNTGMTYAGLMTFGPENLGGLGDVHAMVEAEVQRTGRPYQDIAMDVH